MINIKEMFYMIVYRLTGECKTFIPDNNGTCKICKWDRNLNG